MVYTFGDINVIMDVQIFIFWEFRGLLIVLWDLAVPGSNTWLTHAKHALYPFETSPWLSPQLDLQFKAINIFARVANFIVQISVHLKTKLHLEHLRFYIFILIVD